jgi:cytochrome c oxidase cbb3-type subunit I/II
MLVLVYNIAKTIMVNETIEDELAEAPELQKISSSCKGVSPLVREKPIQLTILATIAILIGGVIQIVPTIMVKSNIPTTVQTIYPLELESSILEKAVWVATLRW